MKELKPKIAKRKQSLFFKVSIPVRGEGIKTLAFSKPDTERVRDSHFSGGSN
ncbi:hypothetical protein FDUTEX481_04835 [Tolypothrix sp. PCC 7601]|nr:hypothetical protein FDUTEX481_04835 [Tolypothrix sp. PCC 7601]